MGRLDNLFSVLVLMLLQKENMKQNIFDIFFESGGKQYSGWVNPSQETDGNGKPQSFHVVIDGVSFGHLSLKNCQWTNNAERPGALIDAVGKEIEKHYQI